MFFTRISVVEHWSDLSPERRETRRILENGPMMSPFEADNFSEVAAVESSDRVGQETLVPAENHFRSAAAKAPQRRIQHEIDAR